MRKFINGIYSFSGALSVIALCAICAVVSLQVLFNIINALSVWLLGKNPGLLFPSYTEFAGFFLVASSFLGLAYALKDDEHIRVVLVLHYLNPVWQKFTECFACIVALIICLYLSYYTIELLLESWQYNDLSIGTIPVPLWIPQLTMVLGIIILALGFLDRLIRTLSTRVPS